MKLHKTLTEIGATEANIYGYKYRVKTETGWLYVSIVGKCLFCNFIGSEETAKAKFGHWKQNCHTDNEQDIINHLNSLKE